MSCPPNPAPPKDSAPLAQPYPSDLHAFAQGILDQHLKTGSPAMFEPVRGIVGGQRVVARVEWHSWTTDKNGKLVPCNPCCTGVSVLQDLSSGIEPVRTSINWPIVIGTGAAAATVVALFVLAIRHAGRARR